MVELRPNKCEFVHSTCAYSMSPFRRGKHVVFATRDNMTVNAEKSARRISEHVVFFTASNAPFHVTVNGIRYAQKRKRSKAVKLHDGTPWKPSYVLTTICAHENNTTATLAWCYARIQMISGQEMGQQAKRSRQCLSQKTAQGPSPSPHIAKKKAKQYRMKPWT